MSNLVPILVVAIIAYSIYRLFELFVCRKERMALIEKAISNPEFNINALSYLKRLTAPRSAGRSFMALRIGLLLLGLGLGIVAASFFDIAWRENHQAVDSMYLACIVLGGGLGLVISYFIEAHARRNDKAAGEE